MMNLSALDESQLFDSPSALALEARMGSPPLPLSLFPSSSPLAPPLPRHITTPPRALSLSRSIAFPRISHTLFRLPLLFAPPSPPPRARSWFAYYNIDWQAAGPKGSDARMNQFVPQLMLGNPLDGSSGPPLYKPKWHAHKTWCFGAQ